MFALISLSDESILTRKKSQILKLEKRLNFCAKNLNPIIESQLNFRAEIQVEKLEFSHQKFKYDNCTEIL